MDIWEGLFVEEILNKAWNNSNGINKGFYKNISKEIMDEYKCLADSILIGSKSDLDRISFSGHIEDIFRRVEIDDIHKIRMFLDKLIFIKNEFESYRINETKTIRASKCITDVAKKYRGTDLFERRIVRASLITNDKTKGFIIDDMVNINELPKEYKAFYYEVIEELKYLGTPIHSISFYTDLRWSRIIIKPSNVCDEYDISIK